MPQVFGSDELVLIAKSSLWVEAGFLEDVEAHEKALHDAGFENQEDLPVYLDTSGFHPRGYYWGQHLTSDKNHHTWVVARTANPEVDPNRRDTNVGGRHRYAVELHKVPVNPDNARTPGSVTPLWEGNDIRHFLTGQRRDSHDQRMTWPQVQRVMQKGTGR